MNPKSTFFKQSCWMIISTTIGGILMWSVHRIASEYLPQSEYGTLGMFLRCLNLITIPACGLQTAFARQTAISLTDTERSHLSYLISQISKYIIILWIVCMLGVCCCFHPIIEILKLSESFVFFAGVTSLLILLRPIGIGVLQGEQNFLWIGWTQILDGAIRLGTISLILIFFARTAASSLIGVLGGVVVCIAICLWKIYPLYMHPRKKCSISRWCLDLIPITLGTGIPLFMISADTLIVQAVFSDKEIAIYAAAGIVTQALIFFTIPVTSVMFPKIARNTAYGNRTSVFFLGLGLTAALTGSVVLGVFLFPKLPIQIMFSSEFLPAAELLPWFALSMFPLALTTVLINNLLATGKYVCVYWLWGIAAIYICVLILKHDSLQQVIAIIGGFNLIMLGVVIYFNLRSVLLKNN